MAGPRMHYGPGSYEAHLARHMKKKQSLTVQEMMDFHYRSMGRLDYPTPSQEQPKPKTNAIGIPLIKNTGEHND